MLPLRSAPWQTTRPPPFQPQGSLSRAFVQRLSLRSLAEFHGPNNPLVHTALPCSNRSSGLVFFTTLCTTSSSLNTSPSDNTFQNLGRWHINNLLVDPLLQTFLREHACHLGDLRSNSTKCVPLPYRKRGAALHCERARHVQPLAARLLQILCRQGRGPHIRRPTAATSFAGSGLSRRWTQKVWKSPRTPKPR